MKRYAATLMVILFLISDVFSGSLSFFNGLPDDYRDLVIQVGAFRKESNAMALENRLTAMINQPVNVEPENGFFKVRVSGFASREELERIYASLGLLGIGKPWIMPSKREEAIPVEADPIPPDSTIIPLNSDTLTVAAGKKPAADSARISLQVGVFHDKSEALKAQRVIRSNFNLTVEIVQEWEYYKVLVSGFTSVEETGKYYPQLAKLGYPDILLIDNH